MRKLDLRLQFVPPIGNGNDISVGIITLNTRPLPVVTGMVVPEVDMFIARAKQEMKLIARYSIVV